MMSILLQTGPDFLLAPSSYCIAELATCHFFDAVYVSIHGVERMGSFGLCELCEA